MYCQKRHLILYFIFLCFSLISKLLYLFQFYTCFCFIYPSTPKGVECYFLIYLFFNFHFNMCLLLLEGEKGHKCTQMLDLLNEEMGYLVEAQNKKDVTLLYYMLIFFMIWIHMLMKKSYTKYNLFPWMYYLFFCKNNYLLQIF